VDGAGKALAPGFIDTHSHDDAHLSAHRDALSAVSQGITTVIVGQDGGASMPLGRLWDTLGKAPVALNVASYAGHNSIRSAVLGENFRRKATAKEVDSMAVLLRHEMGAGALGLSSGLEYDPGIYSDPSEVLALAKVAADSGGRYISHIRSEDRWFWQAIDEIITIGRVAKLPVQVSHMKLAMRPLWGQADSLLAKLDAARAAGVNITADVYPYTFWQSTLTVLFPTRDFADRAEAEKVLREIAAPEGLLLSAFAPETTYVGKTVAEIAKIRHTDAATTLMALIKESQAYGKAHPENENVEGVIATSMEEADVAKLIAWPHTNICSDGALVDRHPRGIGTYPKVLGRYVREQKLIPLEEAIRKMSGLAATNVGLKRRGEIRPGNFADLVLFDPATVTDRATPLEPRRLSEGVLRVWVNGAMVFADGKATGAYPGRVIRRGDH
ncbi:MAG: amidohydrolase family protein, partial [Gemmatimonadota bacterium]